MVYFDNMESFKDWLSKAINKAGWTYQELGGMIGVGHPSISNWVNGKHLPDPDVLLKLAEVTHEDPYRLFNMVYGLPMPASADIRANPLREKIYRRLDGLDDEILEIIDVQLDKVLIPLVAKILKRAQQNEPK